MIGALLGSQDMHHACSGVWLALTALATNGCLLRVVVVGWLVCGVLFENYTVDASI